MYTSLPDQALSSLNRNLDGQLEVFSCHECGHVQTSELYNSQSYYDNDYDILTGSEDEDQIYSVAPGQSPLFRTQHQVNLLLAKLDLPEGARLLDYGCAKSSTMRALQGQRPDLAIHLFDVSDRYQEFWAKFLAKERCATYEIPAQWHGSFDAITSFFSLEHIQELANTLQKMRRLLREQGRLYAIVPNVFTNIGDFLVADHVNHFSHTSIEQLLALHGFELIELDDHSHRGAFVIVAKVGSASLAQRPSPAEVDRVRAATETISRFWRNAETDLRRFETAHAEHTAAIYGAGFYGSYIAGRLAQPEKVQTFVDQNPYLQGTVLLEKPVVALDRLPDGIRAIYLAVNPASAEAVKADIEQKFPNRFSFFQFQP
ncbi:class I SAM-dependent methyltransferase [Neisseriaceae bacterium JH1-16]|nr:class I SAM-dependent methyltransferase [Neisseriaceae bacterium JH1-16]